MLLSIKISMFYQFSPGVALQNNLLDCGNEHKMEMAHKACNHLDCSLVNGIFFLSWNFFFFILSAEDEGSCLLFI